MLGIKMDYKKINLVYGTSLFPSQSYHLGNFLFIPLVALLKVAGSFSKRISVIGIH